MIKTISQMNVSTSKEGKARNILAFAKSLEGEIASVDKTVNKVCKAFTEASVNRRGSKHLSKNQVKKIVVAFIKMQRSIDSNKKKVLANLRYAISNNIPNDRLVAHYDDLNALSSKIAILNQTALASLGADVLTDEDSDLIQLDESGYVVDNDSFVDEVVSEDEDVVVSEEIDDLEVSDSIGNDDEDSDDIVARRKARARRRALLDRLHKKAQDEELEEVTSEEDTDVTSEDEVVDNNIQARRRARARRALRSKIRAMRKRAEGEVVEDVTSEDDLTMSEDELIQAKRRALRSKIRAYKRKAQELEQDVTSDDVTDDLTMSEDEVIQAKRRALRSKIRARRLKAEGEVVVEDNVDITSEEEDVMEDVDIQLDAPKIDEVISSEILAEGEDLEDIEENEEVVTTSVMKRKLASATKRTGGLGTESDILNDIIASELN